MITDPLGLYIHVPFCVRKCKYCDFCSLPIADKSVPDEYIDRLKDEIEAYSEYGKMPLSTIYIGGGTPSILSAEQLEKICSAIKYHFNFDKNIEFTLEANPGTVTREKLLGYRECGVNRISFGLQSIHDTELSALGRIHTFDDFLDSYNIARECGFDNINIDLMYGIPHQTIASFSKTLEKIISLFPEHISVYGLIVEEGTPFYDLKDKLPLPNEGCECDMYYLACGLLKEAGYSHYEISNYARCGYESRHNLKYWRAENYIGIGTSAASYFCGKRYVNSRSVREYLGQTGLNYHTVEEVDRNCQMFEYAMMRLRLSEGFSLEDYKARFGTDFTLGKRSILNKLCERGLIKIDGGRLFLTERGFYVSNAILTEIL